MHVLYLSSGGAWRPWTRPPTASSGAEIGVRGPVNFDVKKAMEKKDN